MGSLHGSPGSSTLAVGAKRGISCCREVRAAQVPKQGLLVLASLIAFAFEKGLNPAILIRGRTSIKGDPQVLICFHEKGFARSNFPRLQAQEGCTASPEAERKVTRGFRRDW